MNKVLIPAIAVLFVNIIAGLVLSIYPLVNMLYTSVAIIVNTLLVVMLFALGAERSHRLSLGMLFLLAGIIEFVSGMIAPSGVKDNWWIILFAIFTAIEAICQYFQKHEITGIVPKNTNSCCKRVCMFLRWMVRKGSPVDIGIWSELIDRRTLIMPLDTHVIQQAMQLGLLKSKSATMVAARRLTEELATFFPEDPLKADFALFGYGVKQ